MIVLHIDSGLGNQMFKYAASRALANKLGTELFLDVDVACREGYGIGQTYQLDHFNIRARHADKDVMQDFAAESASSARYQAVRAQLRNLKVVRSLATVLRRVGVNPSRALPPGKLNEAKVFEEPEEDWAYKPEFMSLPDNTLIKGYFPSFKYFDHLRAQVIDEFTLKCTSSSKTREVAEKIRGSRSVSIHFRRGDVVTNEKYKSWYEGVTTPAYYRNAIRYCSERLDNPHFYVFSNDLDWVRRNFSFPAQVTYVDHNPPTLGYEDLYLMSLCQHNVTTGCSSFSWWAAYLNRNPDKMVLRSNRMNYHDHLNHPQDFFPPSWVVIDSQDAAA